MKSWVKKFVKGFIWPLVYGIVALLEFIIGPVVLISIVVGEWAMDTIIGLLNEYVQPAYDYTIGYNYFATIHLVYCHKLDKLKSIDVEDYNLFLPGIDYTYPLGDRVCEKVEGSTYFSHGITGDRTDFSKCVQPMKTYTYPAVIDEDTSFNIYAPEAFGGIDSTGGIDGRVRVMFGQGVTAFTTINLNWLDAAINADGITLPFMPSYQGMFSLILTGSYSQGDGMNFAYNSTQLRPWSIMGEKTSTRYEEIMIANGTPTRATDYKIPNTFTYTTRNGTITCNNLNPIFILLDCLLDSDWGGLGFTLPANPYTGTDGDIDEPAFHDAAVTLFGEGFGLSMQWKEQESIDAFISRILSHINGVLFVTPTDGKFSIALVRDGGTATITLDESNVISLENYEIKATTENINKLTVQYTENNNVDSIGSVTVDSLGSIRTRGSSALAEQSEIQHTTRDYWGVTNGDIALKIATRDLLMMTVPLSKVTVLVNRTVYSLVPGDIFTFSWESLGITSIVMRVISIDVGSLDSNVMRIDAIADIFSYGDAVVTTAPPSEWIDPSQSPPEDINSIFIYSAEVSYAEAFNKVPAFDNTKSYIGHSCLKPSRFYINYTFLDKLGASPDYIERGTLPYSTMYLVQLDTPLVIEQISTVVTVDSIPSGIRELLQQSDKLLGKIGAELVILTGITGDKELTVIRGGVDTVVYEHVAGSVIRFIDPLKNNFGNFVSLLEVTVGQAYTYKLLPTNTFSTLLESDATEHTDSVIGRIQKPYPPGNVLINNEAYPSKSTLLDVINGTMYSATTPFGQQNTVTFAVTDGVSSTRDFRIIIPKEQFSFLGFSQIKLLFNGVGDTRILTCYVGLNADPNINAYDFYTTPTQVLFNSGDPDAVIQKDGITSDAVSITLDGSRDVLVSFTMEALLDTAGYGLDYGYSYGSITEGNAETSRDTYILYENVNGITTGKTYTYPDVNQAGSVIASSGYSLAEAVCTIYGIRVGDIATDRYTRVSWAHRDRISQGGDIIGQNDPTDYGPEAGVTYTLRIYNAVTTNLLRTLTGLTKKWYDYTEIDEKLDNGGILAVSLRIELESVRGAEVSNIHNITIDRGGYGVNYGTDYGE